MAVNSTRQMGRARNAILQYFEQKLFIPKIEQLSALKAQFKYIGAVDPESDRKPLDFRLTGQNLENSFSPDGLGRIGAFKIDVPSEAETKINLVIKPERFRAQLATLADAFVESHSADWELRDAPRQTTA